MIEKFTQPFGSLHLEDTPDGGCDLCGESKAYVVVEESPARLRTVVCSKCGLIYASPQPSPADIDFLNDNNPGDEGSFVRAPEGILSERALKGEERDAEWGFNIVRKHISVRGNTILNVRSRSGALSARLVAEGANVYGMDSYETNLRHALRERELSASFLVPISRYHDFDMASDLKFDCVVALNVHVLAHVISPRLLLRRLFDVLTPGGYLFLDEKDALQVRPNYDIFALDTGHAHLFHLTLETTRHYIRSAGFEIIECEIDNNRTTSHKHIRVVARKPTSGLNHDTYAYLALPSDLPPGKDIGRRIRRLEQAIWLREQREVMKSRIRRSLKKIPGMRQAWRISQHLFGSSRPR